MIKTVHSFLDYKVKGIIIALILIEAIMIGIVMYDAFAHDVPLYYILYTIPGLLLSLFFKKLENVHRDSKSEKITKSMDIVGFILILGILFIRQVLLLEILQTEHVIFALDAVLIATIAMYTCRIAYIWNGVTAVFAKKHH